MKMTVLMMTLLAATLAHAEEIKILEIKAPVNGYSVESNFEINKDMGRAWVETNVRDFGTPHDESSYIQSYRSKVEGLRYDDAIQAVVLEKDGRIVECGKRKRVGLPGLRTYVIKPTGLCKFTKKEVTVIEDNGYETYKVTRLQVTMNVE